MNLFSKVGGSIASWLKSTLGGPAAPVKPKQRHVPGTRVFPPTYANRAIRRASSKNKPHRIPAEWHDFLASWRP